MKSVCSNEVTYAHDLETREDIMAALSTISAKVGRRLRRKGSGTHRGREDALRQSHDALSPDTLVVPTDDDIAFAPVVHRLARSCGRRA